MLALRDDWGDRFPTIVAAVEALAVHTCTIDGDLIACDANGRADFQLLRWRKRDHPAILCAFDLLQIDGRDLWDEPIDGRVGADIKLWDEFTDVIPIVESPLPSSSYSLGYCNPD
jgi:hypothetical protein